MGFLSFNLSYYSDELRKLENGSRSAADVYHARQLLRMLSDLDDEGYPELGARVEADFCGVSRLRGYLSDCHAAPFAPVSSAPFPELSLDYSPQPTELCTAVDLAIAAAASLSPTEPTGQFTQVLKRFCHWLGYDDGTAYIFLLRDTLLPFVYYRTRGRDRIHPWLLSRRSFARLTGHDDADDELRVSTFGALEAGCTDFEAFRSYVLPRMRRTIEGYPHAAHLLRDLLADIREDHIVVVESGCSGTFPLLLMSLDDRVHLRMYTTYPYLRGIYGHRVYTARYEDMRTFETMTSHEQYLRFADIQNRRFYVQTCTAPAVRHQALSEIREMLP